MEIPNFADLGKNARDVFATGYHHGKGLIKLNVKTKSARRFQITSDTTLNFEASKLSGLMETKYKANAGALLLKWTTEANDLNASTSLLGSFVVRCRDLFVGYRGGYDTALNKMTKNDIGLAYGCADVDFHFRCTCIPHEYGLSVLYKVNPDLDIAANGIYARRGDLQKWTVGAGAKCKLDEKSTLRFKFNTDLQLATSLLQKLNDGITLILSFNIDCAKITRGGHRVGLALNVEA
ncbi:hypothetical protein DMN91_005811 [Ooceraea biroi]|uniref:Voltage-dependent anion-selective channel protein n=1 Tax=Ooceraea biroi TaxID=2015173 RepID=A0A3L8DNQ6_OOCBI|nr:hypothetical protein DMN91_005811 [Ooceraea biroi]